MTALILRSVAVRIRCLPGPRLPESGFDLASAAAGTFAVAPVAGMLPRLERDYQSMSGMIFGPIPPFDSVVASLLDLERRLNDRP